MRARPPGPVERGGIPGRARVFEQEVRDTRPTVRQSFAQGGAADRLGSRRCQPGLAGRQHPVALGGDGEVAVGESAVAAGRRVAGEEQTADADSGDALDQVRLRWSAVRSPGRQGGVLSRPCRADHVRACGPGACGRARVPRAWGRPCLGEEELDTGAARVEAR